MKKKNTPNINIKNRKASFEYEFIDKFEAGIMLVGSEIKSLRNGDANITEAFCYIDNNEIFIKNLYIKQYSDASWTNHEERRDRKLLLHKREINRIKETLKNQSLTIIPANLYINNKGLAKINIAVARGKKNFDTRVTIKGRDIDRDMKREAKI